MSPFKSFKKSGCTSSSSKYALEGANTIGVAVTSTSNETWSSGNYSYIAFRQPGQFTVNRSGKIDICVVGGGGAGGGVDTPNPGILNVSGGGGGAGGVLQRYGQTFNVGTYYVEIGGGGSAEEPGYGFPSSIQGRPFPSTGIALTAYGGGRGARQPYGVGNGASGGGASWGAGLRGEGNYQSPLTAVLIPAPLQPQGYPGGYSNGTAPPASIPEAHGQSVGSGGGGAGGPGFSFKTPSTGGDGGQGVSIFNGDGSIPTTYGTPAPPSYAPGRYVGGGGGGGGMGGGGGAGGVGGGAPGSSPISPSALQLTCAAGTKYTGGGGGGALNGSFGQGGPGGSGLVIIRWKNIISRGD
jgi:hypothetical protein